MAKIKFYSGTKEKVDAKAYEAGAFYVATDTEELAVDIADKRMTFGNTVWDGFGDTVNVTVNVQGTYPGETLTYSNGEITNSVPTQEGTTTVSLDALGDWSFEIDDSAA